MIIRSATAADSQGILEAHQDSIRKVASKDYNALQVAGWSDHLTPEGYVRAMEKGEVMFVAILDGKIVGFSAIKAGNVRALYVASHGIGKGIAKKLYAELENVAKKDRITKLTLSSSLTAEGFYTHMGFKKIEMSAHRLGSGVEIPCVKMEKFVFL
jgi:N-acetylglutamate synthase-like GNAT family acetyltransferase